jgi:ubiquinone/menaquinone biosynthesis C-methylase UbiE
MTGPSGNIQAMSAPYDEIAEAYEDHAADSSYNAHYDRPAVLALLGDVAGARVLDAGCGPGFYAEELLARGATVVAIDVSEAMLSLARRRLGDRAEIRHADLDEPLPFEDAYFDLVVCPLVIHYVLNRTAALREFFRVLRPGGHAVLSTQHPTTDWLRKGGSYFDVSQEKDVWARDVWKREGQSLTVRFWREPLTGLCESAAEAGFFIERLVEPLPAESMRERWPDDWQKLQREPGFLILRLAKVPINDPPLA